jgi:hypothetical protein
MGQCQLFLGEHEKAISLFERFLSEKPDTPYRSDVEKLIAEAQRELDKQREAEELAKAPPPPPPVELPPPLEETPAIKEPPPYREVEIETPPPVEESDPVYTKWWFWTIIGVAAAGGATAAIVATQSGDEVVLPSGTVGTLDRR